MVAGFQTDYRFNAKLSLHEVSSDGSELIPLPLPLELLAQPCDLRQLLLALVRTVQIANTKGAEMISGRAMEVTASLALSNAGRQTYGGSRLTVRWVRSKPATAGATARPAPPVSGC